jgi:hypothetical protein
MGFADHGHASPIGLGLDTAKTRRRGPPRAGTRLGEDPPPPGPLDRVLQVLGHRLRENFWLPIVQSIALL